MAIIRGSGNSADDPIVVNDYFSLYNVIKTTPKAYIELDPDAENKIIDMNDYPIGTIGISNNGCNIFSYIDSDIRKIEGNGWTIKNLWAIDLPTYDNAIYGLFHNRGNLTINRLNLLNLFVSCNLSSIYHENFPVIYVYENLYLNDCKFTVLITGNSSCFFRTMDYLFCNRCSFTIKSLNKSFILCRGTTYLNMFRNCNFRLNIKNLNCLQYSNENDSTMYCTHLEFCKFSGIIHNGKLLSNYERFSKEGGKSNFLNNIWQLNFKNNEDVRISDSVLTLVNSDVSNMKALDSNDSNTLICNKEQLLDINFLNEKGFPVMFKENIIEGEV